MHTAVYSNILWLLDFWSTPLWHYSLGRAHMRQQRQREVIHSELVPQISYWLRENETEKYISFLFIISCHATGQMIDCICYSRYALDCTVLYCTVLYCTVLYCTVLYCNLICSANYCSYTSVDINVSEYTYALHNFEWDSLIFYSLTLSPFVIHHTIGHRAHPSYIFITIIYCAAN